METLKTWYHTYDYQSPTGADCNHIQDTFLAGLTVAALLSLAFLGNTLLINTPKLK